MGCKLASPIEDVRPALVRDVKALLEEFSHGWKFGKTLESGGASGEVNFFRITLFRHTKVWPNGIRSHFGVDRF